MVLGIGGVLLLIHERKRLGIKDNGLVVVEVADFYHKYYAKHKTICRARNPTYC
jgi:hypothetical protein